MEVRPKYRKLQVGDQQAIDAAVMEISKTKKFLTRANFLHLVSLGGDPLADKSNIINYIKNEDSFYLQYVLTHCQVDLISRYRGGYLLDIAMKHQPKHFMMLYHYGAGMPKDIITQYVNYRRYHTHPEIYLILLEQGVNNFNHSLLEFVAYRVDERTDDTDIDILVDILSRINQNIGYVNTITSAQYYIYYGISLFVHKITHPPIFNLCKRLILLGLDNSFIRPLYETTKSDNLLPLLEFLDYYESGFNPVDFKFYPQTFQQQVLTLIACNEFGSQLEFLPIELLLQIIDHMR